MATQVKPFQTLISIGYIVWCEYDDGETAPEHEGVVYFYGQPRVGDKAVLSDGKEWVVTRESNEDMEMWMKEL
jgi:hypothetical protein